MYGPGCLRHGLGLRYRHLSSTCAYALGCLGCIGFFHTHTENFRTTSQTLPKKVDCFQIAPCRQCLWLPWPPFCLSAATFSATFSSQRLQNHAVIPVFLSAGMPLTTFLHGNFRITPSFTFSCLPLTTFLHGDFRFPCHHKRGIRSTTLSKCDGMESRWIASRRHYQVRKYVPSLVTRFLHISGMLYPAYATSLFLRPPLLFFSSTPHALAIPLILQHINMLASSLVPAMVVPVEYVSDRQGSLTRWSTENLVERSVC